jgi:glycosyltransferase involved in cell wall biosynthesis
MGATVLVMMQPYSVETTGLKVLVVTPFPVLPLVHGGRVRSFRLASGLAATGASVDVLCPWGPGLPHRPFRADGVTVHPHRLLANALPRLLRDRRVPSQVALSWQPERLGPRRLLARFRDYDVVQFEFVAQARWTRSLDGRSAVVYSAHNVESDFLRRGPLAPSLSGYSLRRIEELEREAVARADLVVACTVEDEQRLGELYGRPRRVTVVHNGFDDELLHFDRGERRAGARAALGLADDELAVLFVGGAAHHNREAARLATIVLPRIRRRARLLLVGNSAHAVAPTPGVLSLGYQDDLRDALSAADVAVNPVGFGSGSNIKMPVYLAAGLPIVTTPVGLRGFEELAAHALVADPEGFAEAIPRALELPPAPRVRLEPLTWGALARRLAGAYASLDGRAG